MVDHVKMTFGILFVNIILTLIFPTQVLGDGMEDYLYTQGEGGEFKVSPQFLESFGGTVNDETGLPNTDINILTVFKLIYEFIKLLFVIALATPILLLYMSGIFQLLVGIPIVLAYMFAIMGWIYR